MTLFPLPPHAIQRLRRLQESSPPPAAQAHLEERFFSADQRRDLAAKGHALPDGSFPIENAGDLASAIHLVGKGGPAAKAHIIKRARALGLLSKLPPDWKVTESATSSGRTAGCDEGAQNAAGTDVAADPRGAVPLSEHVELIEALVIPSDDAALQGRHIVEVTLIRSGESKMGNLYPPDVLARSAPLFEGAIAYADHNRRDDLPERSVRDIVGHYRSVHSRQDSSGTTSLRAQLHLLPGTDWLFALLSEAQSHPSICGLSIDAYGQLNEAESARLGKQVVGGFARVNSIDVVTRPSAGGGVVRVLQSDSPTTPPERPSPAMNTCPHCHKHLQESEACDCAASKQAGNVALAEAAPPTENPTASTTPPPTTPPPTNNQGLTTNNPAPDLASLMEAMIADRKKAQGELARIASILNPNPDPTHLAEQSARSDIVRLAEELRRDRDEVKRQHDLVKADAALSRHLTEAALPLPVESKIKKRFSGTLFNEAQLTEAIAEEKDVLAALDATGEIRGMGYERSFSMGMNEYEKVQAAFDKLFDVAESDLAKAVPPFSGLREAFYVATGKDIAQVGGANLPIRESLAHSLGAYVRAGRLQESEVLLREADVTTASFSYLLGTSMNKRLLKDYQAWPSEWQKFSTITAIKDFKQQDRVRLGAFGSLSTVAEDAAYTTLTVADTRAIYTPAKRGNLVQVTRETIINDDLYAIKQIPQKLAVAAAFTLAEFVYNLLAPGGANIYDAHPLFDSVNHLNTGVTSGNLSTANQGSALASSALQTAVIKMRKQTNMAGKPIGLKPRYLLVCPDLEFTAMTILRSAGLPGGSNNDINPMMGYAEPIVSPQLNALAAGPASTTICIAVAAPRAIDTLEVGFVGGQANPVLLIQDMPLYGLNFTQDTISYKVRHEYGGAIVDYRGFYLINN